jgi:hypothetical protein
MDKSMRSLCDYIETRYILGSNAGRTLDITNWLAYFAWDFLGEMTFSKRFGFMEEEKDWGGMIRNAKGVQQYFSLVRPFQHSVLCQS